METRRHQYSRKLHDTVSGFRRFLRGWAGPITFGIVVVTVGLPLRASVSHLVPPVPADLAPGLQIDAGPYVPPEHCPERVWQVAEFLPATCALGGRLDLEQQRAAGLERPVWIGDKFGRRRWSGYLQRYWVRTGSNALLVVGPEGGEAHILKVVEDRYYQRAATLPRTSEARNWRWPSRQFFGGLVVELARVPMFAILIVVGALALTEWPRRAHKRRVELFKIKEE